MPVAERNFIMKKSETGAGRFYFLLYDMKNAVRKNWLMIVVVLPICFAICAGVNRKTSFLRVNGIISSQAGFWNYMADAYAGMEEYFPTSGVKFEIPAIWLLLTLFVPFTAANYAYHEMHNGAGVQVLIRMKKRTGWILGKVVYCLMRVLLFHAIVWLGIFLFSIIKNGSLSSSEEIYFAVSGLNMAYLPSHLYFYVSLIVFPMMMSLFLAVSQTILSLILKPVWAYLFIVVYVIASVYFRFPFLIADYTMIFRNQCVMFQGIDSVRGMFILLTLIIIEIVMGIFIFQKKDLLKKEEEGGLWK